MFAYFRKRGSDVRLDLGIPYRPNAGPRAAARPYLWSWEVVHGYPWRESEDTHINKLELLATLSTVKWRLRSSKQQRCRLLHLVDSQVVGAIVTKGRTSSLVLRSTIQKLSALLIAGCVYPSYLYVASEDNPADLPSRWQWVGNFRRPGLKLRPSDRGCAKPKRR